MTKAKKPPMPQRRNQHTFAKGGPLVGAAAKSAARKAAALPPVEPPDGINITPAQLLGLTKLAAEGVRPADLRHAVAMSQAVWNAYCAAHGEVGDAIEKGVAQMHNTLVAAQMKKAKKGDFMASALLLNGRFGYRDPSSEGGSTRVQVNVVNLPAADTRDVKIGDVIEHDDTPIPGMTVVAVDARPIKGVVTKQELDEAVADVQSQALPDTRLYPSNGDREQHRDKAAHAEIDAQFDAIAAATRTAKRR